MRQISQSLKDGRLCVREVPAPLVKPGCVLIANSHSVISAGTERSVIDTAKSSLLSKARQRPDQVRRVLEKMRQEGVLNALQQVFAKLDEPIGLGYSSAGLVLAVGAHVQGFSPGDRVASNGPHAGVVCVPKHLCAVVPESVPSEQAAYTVIASIALNGVRLARVGLGDVALVIGLGLVGQIAVALLKASGCRVLGTDPDSWKCELALRMGCEIAKPELTESEVVRESGSIGADAVLVTASTPSDAPIVLAAESVRPKGRVVVVGAVGMNVPRRPMYFKEAELVVACSYGPGRYDAEYEERGKDYPAGHVRWTEQRNFKAVLKLMASGRLDLTALTTHRFPAEKAEEAYGLLENGSEKYLGILLQYPSQPENTHSVRKKAGTAGKPSASCAVGVLGAGAFARAVLLPTLQRVKGLHLKTLCTSSGLSADSSSERYGFEIATTDEAFVFNDPDIKAIFCLTRHDTHARHAIRALESGKHVYVEKPLALSVEELAAIETALKPDSPLLMVGFNRRFAPSSHSAKAVFRDVNVPLTISIRMNVGHMPDDHWTQDPELGGGRIVGEACHAIDLATYLAGSLPVRVYAEGIGGVNAPRVADDQCFILLRHANGSVSSIGYLAGGDKAYPKERVEILGGGRLAVIEDFKELVTVVNGRVKRQKSWNQDKGHSSEVGAFVKALLEGTQSPIPWEELRAVSLASILAVQSLREGVPFEVI